MKTFPEPYVMTDDEFNVFLKTYEGVWFRDFNQFIDVMTSPGRYFSLSQVEQIKEMFRKRKKEYLP